MPVVERGNIVSPEPINGIKCDIFKEFIESLIDPENYYTKVNYNNFKFDRSSLLSAYKVYINFRIHPELLVVDIMVVDDNNYEDRTIAYVDVNNKSIAVPTVDGKIMVFDNRLVYATSDYVKKFISNCTKLLFSSFLGHNYVVAAYPDVSIDLNIENLLDDIFETSAAIEMHKIIRTVNSFKCDLNFDFIFDLVTVFESEKNLSDSYNKITAKCEKVIKCWREVWTFSTKYPPLLLNEVGGVSVTIEFGKELNPNASAPGASLNYNFSPHNIEEEKLCECILLCFFSRICKFSDLAFLYPVDFYNPLDELTCIIESIKDRLGKIEIDIHKGFG